LVASAGMPGRCSAGYEPDISEAATKETSEEGIDGRLGKIAEAEGRGSKPIG
jgi:hypothetical protein